MLPNCPLILCLLLGLINIATSAPTSNNINSIDDDNYCELSFYKTNYPRTDYLITSVSNDPMDGKIHIKGAKSYEVSTSPKAHCCWMVFKIVRKNGRRRAHRIHKIEKKPGENNLYYKQFYRRNGYWVETC